MDEPEISKSVNMSKNTDEIDVAGYISLKNYRDPPVAEPSVEGEGEGVPKDKTIDPNEGAESQLREDEVFDLAKISNKIILATPVNPEPIDINLAVYHSEAGFALRKHIIERARNHWAKDLKEINVNEVLSHTAKKARTMEQMFEDQLLGVGFNQGEMYKDTNIQIIYKTFLKPNDQRLLAQDH